MSSKDPHRARLEPQDELKCWRERRMGSGLGVLATTDGRERLVGVVSQGGLASYCLEAAASTVVVHPRQASELIHGIASWTVAVNENPSDLDDNDSDSDPAAVSATGEAVVESGIVVRLHSWHNTTTLCTGVLMRPICVDVGVVCDGTRTRNGVIGAAERPQFSDQ